MHIFMTTSAPVFCVFYILKYLSVCLNVQIFISLLLNKWESILTTNYIVNGDKELLVNLMTACRHNARTQKNNAVVWDVTIFGWIGRQST